MTFIRALNQTRHQNSIERFMMLAGQELPRTPTIPSEKVRRLRALLILEEAFETVRGLGFDLAIMNDRELLGNEDAVYLKPDNMLNLICLPLNTRGCNIIEVADGCADLSVVTIGTLSAFGIADTHLLDEVDQSNLRKFGPSSFKRDDGKWIKPPNWRPPDIAGILRIQGYKEVEDGIPSTPETETNTGAKGVPEVREAVPKPGGG